MKKYAPIIIFVLVVILLTGIILFFDHRQKNAKVEETTEAVTSAAVETSGAESVVQRLADFEKYGLQQDAVPEITALISEYHHARVNGDAEKMLKLYGRTVEDAELKAKLENDKRYFENFSDTVCYETAGAVTDSYLVFVQSKIKFRFVDTLAPSFTWVIVQKQTDGSFVMKDPYNLTTEETALVSKVSAGTQVKDLIAQTDKELAEAVISDAELANMYKMMSNSSVSTANDDIVEESEETQPGESVSEAQISIIMETNAEENGTEEGTVEESSVQEGEEISEAAEAQETTETAEAQESTETAETTGSE